MRSELAVLSWNENVWNARNCAARRITKGISLVSAVCGYIAMCFVAGDINESTCSCNPLQFDLDSSVLLLYRCKILCPPSSL